MAHLLVVDDEPSARSTLALLLRKRGHRVLEADGLASATARLSDEVFDLVVTDLRMPDGDGLDVLRAAKAHAPATEVILLTAYAEWKSAKEAIRLGALDYFEKGQEPDELYHRIDKALAGRARRRGLQARSLRGSRRRHLVPGRDRRDARRAPGEAPARAPERRGAPARRDAVDDHRRARDRGHPRRPVGVARAGQLSRGPLLPAERHPGRAAPAARSSRGHSGARRAFPGPVRR